MSNVNHQSPSFAMDHMTLLRLCWFIPSFHIHPDQDTFNQTDGLDLMHCSSWERCLMHMLLHLNPGINHHSLLFLLHIRGFPLSPPFYFLLFSFPCVVIGGDTSMVNQCVIHFRAICV